MKSKIKSLALLSFGLILTSCNFSITTTSLENSKSNSSTNNSTSQFVTTKDSHETSKTDTTTSEVPSSNDITTSSSEGNITSESGSFIETTSDETTSNIISTSNDSVSSENISSGSPSSNGSTSTSNEISSSNAQSSSSSSSQEVEINPKITNNGVYGEAAFAEWQDSNATNAKVEYKLVSSSVFSQIDNELIRQKTSSIARFDALGLKAGIYEFRITTSSGEVLEMRNISVSSYDRSGYAHFKTSNSVGGYNNDGTVKSNSVIVYVNESNKNTVEAVIAGKTYKGISSILQAQANSSNPLIVRIIGQISAATWNQITYSKGSSNLTASQIVDKNGNPLPEQSLTEEEIISGGYNTLNTSTYTKLNGLTNRIKYSSGEFDSYYNMLDINGAQNVTVEGVGDDAMIFQWGFTWKNCSYIEVRNLTFDDYTEDACSFEGPDDATSLSGFTTGHIWIHNNLFNEGKNYWDVCPEQDKLEGDGATDFKKNANITVSYNRYYKNHKTGLVGGGDSQHTASITYHHNYYDQCSQRLPLARQANMHMYNNYYYKTSTTSLSIRAGAYAFVEGCYFEGGKNPMETKTGDNKKGTIKSYNNVLSSTSGTNNGTVVTNREATVSNDNIYDQKFDTSTTNFYYDSINKVSDVVYLTSAEQAKIDAKAYAGPAKINPSKISSEDSENQTPVDPNPGETEPSGNQEVFNVASLNKEAGTYSSNFSSGIFTVNATANATVSIANNVNYFSSFNDAYTSELKLSGTGNADSRSVSFTITSEATVKIYCRSANTSTARQLVIYNDSNEVVNTFDAIIEASELVYNLSQGSYYIASKNSGMNIGAIVIQYTK